ncbi:hypothetical protein [Hymenobacter latericus]|uniref:hypothetical protein n=1 Tax=Hymenobacter sp. YIM 151858-1 TaxID=2987688 RepID=UPI0022276659|nr:hypothetical protein [Hymenobacter sp. YIM 151858-1]UYZ58044.1 hypothetical protein OIS50_13365 [Hymenobacter sp. YIM 151858-1]
MPQLHTTLTLPRLRIEQAPLDATEADLLARLGQLIEATGPMPDVRALAPAIRALFPAPAYQVGCGGAHIWLHRTDDPNRLALIREDR